MPQLSSLDARGIAGCKGFTLLGSEACSKSCDSAVVQLVGPVCLALCVRPPHMADHSLLAGFQRRRTQPCSQHRRPWWRWGSPTPVLLGLRVAGGPCKTLLAPLSSSISPRSLHGCALQAWTIVSKAYVDSEFGGHEWEGELSQVSASLVSCMRPQSAKAQGGDGHSSLPCGLSQALIPDPHLAQALTPWYSIPPCAGAGGGVPRAHRRRRVQGDRAHAGEAGRPVHAHHAARARPGPGWRQAERQGRRSRPCC